MLSGQSGQSNSSKTWMIKRAFWEGFQGMTTCSFKLEIPLPRYLDPILASPITTEKSHTQPVNGRLGVAPSQDASDHQDDITFL